MTRPRPFVNYHGTLKLLAWLCSCQLSIASSMLLIYQTAKFSVTVRYTRSSEVWYGDAVVDMPVSIEPISLVMDDNMRLICSLSQSERDAACSGRLPRSPPLLSLPWASHAIQHCRHCSNKPNIHVVIITVAMYHSISNSNVFLVQRYGGGVGNIAKKNSETLSLIRMC